MDKIFVERFMEGKPKLESVFSEKHPSAYIDIIKAVCGIITCEDGYGEIDPDRIHQIDDGDYQGTLVFVIAAKGYQPSDYWYVKVGYGSCSGCDTLAAIRNYDDEKPTEDQIKQYMSLALHIVQGIKKMGDEDFICS